MQGWTMGPQLFDAPFHGTYTMTVQVTPRWKEWWQRCCLRCAPAPNVEMRRDERCELGFRPAVSAGPSQLLIHASCVPWWKSRAHPVPSAPPVPGEEGVF